MEIENINLKQKILVTDNDFEMVRKIYSYQNQIKNIPIEIENRRYKKLQEV